MPSTTETTISVEAYLEQEKTSEVRHEYVDGKLYAMAGESKRHNRIVFKIARLLDDASTAKSCQVFIENVKVRTKDVKYRYPDIVVTCEENADQYTVFTPCALFEVLSESTEETDSIDKVAEYLKLGGLDRYVMLRQNQKLAIVYSRDSSGWRIEILEGEGTIDVPCLGTTMTLEQIYDGIELT
jgi:Uma2 family endonuclease